MKSIRHKLACIFLIALSPAVAQEPAVQMEANHQIKQQFGYVSAGVGPLPVPLPVFAAGYRYQIGHHGADLSFQVSTIAVITQIKANCLYHHYFKPNLASEFYVGGGVGPSWIVGSGKALFLISPEFVFGKQYRNETGDLRFFQLQASFPTFSFGNNNSHHQTFKFPLIVISYGIGF